MLKTRLENYGAIGAIGAVLVAMAGCAGQPTTGTASGQSSASAAKTPGPTPTQGPTTVIARAPDSRDGEMIGTPASGSKFAKLKFGMSPQQVTSSIGGSDDTTTHETGKRWIPFYFGPDARRVEVLYKGEGCLTYTGGNRFGSGDNELIKMVVDPAGKCFNS